MYVKMRHRIRFADVSTPLRHSPRLVHIHITHTQCSEQRTEAILRGTTTGGEYSRTSGKYSVRSLNFSSFLSFPSVARSFSFSFYRCPLSSHCRCRLVFNIGTKTDERHTEKKTTNQRTTGNERSEAKKKSRRFSENCWTFLPSQLLTCILFPIFDFSHFFLPFFSSYLHMTHTHRMQSPSGEENIPYSLR